MRKKKALNNIITSIILQFVTIISGLIIPRLFITSFGTNINGLISSATQFLSYITLLESGIGGVARAMLYKPLNNKNKDEIASIIKSVEGFFKKIALVFIVYLIILAFSFKYISNSPLDYYSTFALVIIIGLGSFAQYYFGISYQVLLQADQKQYITTSIQIITIIINVICTYIMIKLGFGILAVKLITSLIFVLRPILLNIYVKKKYELLINSNTKETKLVQAFDGLSHHVAYFLHSNTDIVIITLFLNVSYVSVYAIYNMISSGLRNLSIAFSSSIEATFGNMLANKEYENLKNKFDLVEFLSSSIATLLFVTGFIMIDYFIEIYTHDVTDFNYNIPALGYLLLCSELIYCIRQPYHYLTMAAGDFKKTKTAAWVETIINIILSIILVKILGIIGVVIATVVAMSFRTIYYVFYISRNIIYRSIYKFFIGRIVPMTITILFSFIIFKKLISFNIIGYYKWLLCSFGVFAINLIIIILLSFIFNKKELFGLIDMIKNLLNKTIIRRKKYENN